LDAAGAVDAGVAAAAGAGVAAGADSGFGSGSETDNTGAVSSLTDTLDFSFSFTSSIGVQSQRASFSLIPIDR
jgi:hypothetical protein